VYDGVKFGDCKWLFLCFFRGAGCKGTCSCLDI